MAGEHISAAAGISRLASAVTRSPVFILPLSLLLLLSVLFFFSSSSSFQPHPTTHSSNPNPLETRDDTVNSFNEADVKRFDDLVRKREDERLFGDPFFPTSFPIRVYVYEMPHRFTYDLLRMFRDTYRDTSKLTSKGSPVHRLTEQHSIDYWLWADLIAPESERLLKTVVRVHKQEDADFLYGPFFTTVRFFLLEKQDYKALYRMV